MIHIRTWFARKKAHYKAVKSKTKVRGEVQKTRDKFHFKLAKKLKKNFGFFFFFFKLKCTWFTMC